MKTRLINNKLKEIAFYREMVLEVVFLCRYGFDKELASTLIKTYRTAQLECWKAIKSYEEQEY